MASFFGAPPVTAPPVTVPAAKAVAASSVPPCPGSHPSTPLCLQPAITITENTSEVFAIKFNPDGKFLAACCGDGAIRVFNSETGRMAYNLQRGSAVALPSTAVKFRPDVESVKTKNVLVSADALGNVEHWHMTSGKCLHSFKEEDNQIFALDFRPDATQFATAGKDTAIRIYDEQTKQQVVKMERGLGFGPSAAPGHSNRVFAVKFHHNDPNVLISGGWDNTIQVWDCRAGKAQRSIFGPHLCGEAIDLQGDVILTGSHRADDPLELWDFGSGEKISTVKIFDDGRSEPSQLYSAQFAKASLSGYEEKPRLIACGSSGVNEARVYDMENGNCCVGVVGGMTRAVFATDWSPKANKLAVAGGDASIRFVNVVEKGNVEGGADENVTQN
ncbi:hypothetical protein TrST_g4742 [Triparma strigata]|uniref:Anaphase-promoting complex subunit 4-like WD40 domain-containing protein n=1 Tax=Triparma strigata TaxID=1606541 RepID=A0A9W7B7Z8_9STRA|nr:hypothetical protein TrST_g4742 [Triparma strigata]